MAREIGAGMAAAAFFPAQRSDRHHQAEHRRIGSGSGRNGQRRQRGGSPRAVRPGRATRPPAPDMIGAHRRRHRARGGSSGAGQRARRRGCVAATSSPPSAHRTRLQQRVAGQPVGAMQAGATPPRRTPTARRRCCARPRPRRCRPCGNAPRAAPGSAASPDRSRPPRQAAVIAGKPRGEAAPNAARASRNTRCPRPACAPHRAATTSRGSSSAPAWPAMKRAPVSSMSVAPSPRTASLTSGIGSQPASSAVGWNCTNSRSASAAPARAASISPWPWRRRIGGVPEQPADAAGGQHHAAGRQHERRRAGPHASTPATRAIVAESAAWPRRLPGQ